MDSNGKNGHNGKVPAWLAALGESEWFIDGKKRHKRAAKSGCFDRASRVYEFLGLHTMGFQQELAVKMVAGKKVPITPQDVYEGTGVGPKHLAEVMDSLEKCGLGRMEGSTKGHILLYVWAVPRKVEQEIVPPRGDNSEIPPDIQSLLKCFKINLPSDFVPTRGYIEGARELARGYKESRMVLARFLKGPCAEERIYKEESNESIFESNGASSSSSAFVEESTEEPPKADEEDPPEEIKSQEPPTTPLEEARAEYPADHWDDAKAAQTYREHIKSRIQHNALIEGIRRHKESERWQDQHGRWIPLASNFIAKRLYEYDPPPKLQTASRASPKRDAIAEMIAAEEAKAKGGGT